MCTYELPQLPVTAPKGRASAAPMIRMAGFLTGIVGSVRKYASSYWCRA